MTESVGALPPKIAGEHRWIILASYSVTPEEAGLYAESDEIFELESERLVNAGIGCIDCEASWPDTSPCEAGEWDAPFPDDLLGAEGKERMLAAVDAIGLTGAKGLEIGHEVESNKTSWYAKAAFDGSHVYSKGHADPVAAVEALAWDLLDGGDCQLCHRTVVRSAGDYPFEACVWQRIGDRWISGCSPDH
jgi:hypothetical protein